MANLKNLLKEKIGNEILQVLIVVAVIGALAITICVLVANKMKGQAKDSSNRIGENLDNSVSGALSMEQDKSIGTDGTYE